MKLTSRAAKLLDLACSAVKAGKESASMIDSATKAAVGLAQGAGAGAVVFAPLIASPVFLPCVAAVALGVAGRKVYKEHKAGQAEERIAEQVQERVEQSLKKLLEDYGSIQAAMEDGFGKLELGQIDGLVDHDQLKTDLQTGLAKLTELAAMQRSDRLALAEQNDALVESLSGFDERFGKRFDSLDKKLDETLELLTHRPHFSVRRPPVTDDGLAPLKFASRAVELVGRQTELQRLNRFLEHAPRHGSNFSFWLVTGPGGMGKSRLAHELCLAWHERGWDVGFWSDSSADRWDLWQPEAPTLIVFDYLLSKTEQIGKAISAMARKGPAHPVRFLVLEREAKGAWWTQVSNRLNGPDAEALEDYQYEDDSLQLGGLLDEASRDLAARSFFKHALNTDDESRIDAYIRVFRKTDKQGRPIYAQAIVEAAKEFGIDAVTDFSRAALMLYILEREQKRIAQFIEDPSEQNKLRNLLAITTLARGISTAEQDLWADPGLIGVLPDDGGQTINGFRAVLPSSGAHELPGMEPDLLGEMFVLQQLANVIASVRKKLVRAAWHAKPDDTAMMSYMARHDFGDSAWIEELAGLGVRNDIDSARALDGVTEALRAPAAMIAADVAYVRGRLEEAVQEVSRVIDSADSPAEHRAHALVNRGVTYRQLDRTEDAIADYTRAIELDGAPPDQVARALFNRGFAHAQLGQSGKEIADYSRVVELANAPPDLIAKALVNRGIEHGMQGRHVDAIADYTSAIELDGAPPDQVAKALVGRGVAYGQLDRTEDAIADYTCAIELKDAPAEQVAQALVNRGVRHGQLGQSQRAIADYTRAIELKDAPAEQVAKALNNRGVRHGQLGRFDDAVLDLGEALLRPELAADMRTQAIGLLRMLYRDEEDGLDDATKQAAGRALRDAGVDPDEEGTGDRPPGTGAADGPAPPS